jgi:hypothetical protein
MQLPPAVIVHGVEHARAALAPGLPVTLLSAPGAAIYAGVGWWRAMVAEAAGAATPPPDILDCADAPGRALEALRHGQKLLILRGQHLHEGVFADIAERAIRQGGLAFATAPPALDLATRGADRRLQAWLMDAARELKASPAAI